jgi:hypothetical protein
VLVQQQGRQPSCETAWPPREQEPALGRVQAQAQAERVLRELQLSLLHNTLDHRDVTKDNVLDFLSVAVALAGDFFSAGAAFTGAGLLAASGAGAAFF